MSSIPRLLAFYLPQFHPIPENNEWWGEGFTEWTNVTKARPRIRGHYQPHLPADLGFYDLRLQESREAQAALARQYGIDGFCIYHYWFNGRRLLERPVNDMLRTGSPDFPFCLCWANENWTRAWNGSEREVLLQQNYCIDDDREHMKWLVRVFEDSRYIRIDGKPLISIYRASRLPSVRGTVDAWREVARKAGCGEIYLCAVESTRTEHGRVRGWGFDAAIEFQPDWTNLGKGTIGRVMRRIKDRLLRVEISKHNVYDYRRVAERMMKKETPPYLRFPCVTPMWDNSARRKRGPTILHNSKPEYYEEWLRSAIARSLELPEGKQYVFINGWNEWAEGNHLEPCQRWGRAYLEATALAKAWAIQQKVSST